MLEDRIKIMEELREAIRSGLFLVSLSGDDAPGTTLGPKYLYHHAKLYIADEACAVVTSANFTRHGLMTSREAGIVVTDPDDTAYFVERFDYYYSKAVPLSELLLEKIEEWLKIYSPYEIYMLSLLTLYGLPSDEKPGSLPELAAYQRPVVSRMIRNIDDYGGAMLVASTGLAKTMNRFDDIQLDLDEVYRFIENADKLHTSSFIDDLAAVNDDEIRYLKRLPSGIKSYKKTAIGFNAVYALIQYKNAFYPAIFRENGEIFKDYINMDEIMTFIRSERGEESYPFNTEIDPDKWYEIFLKSWSSKNEIPLDDISVRCMIFLIKGGPKNPYLS